jgi:hypothetical protein
MADFNEIDSLLRLDESSGLRRKVAIATMMAAEAIRQDMETGQPEVQQRKRFAQAVFGTQLRTQQYVRNQTDRALAENKVFEAIYRAFLMARAGDTVAEIQALTDAQIQTTVDEDVTLMAKEFNDP